MSLFNLLKYIDTAAWKDKLMFSLKCQKLLIKVLHKKRKEVIQAQNNQRPLLTGISNRYLFHIKMETGFTAAVGIWERRWMMTFHRIYR